MLARRCIESARDIERGDAGASLVQFIDRRDRFADFAARLSLEAGAEQRVDDKGGAVIDRVRELHRIDRRFSLRYGVGRFRWSGLRHFDDRDLDARAGERAGDDPAVASIVPRTRKDDGAAPEPLGIAPRDLFRRRGTRALHQHA